jgi:hypothetical protein
MKEPNSLKSNKAAAGKDQMGKRNSRAPATLKKRQHGSAVSSADAQLRADMFEYAWAVIDSAVTGAILAGMHPSSIEPALAFWFLNVAAENRNEPPETATTWLRANVFNAVLEAVAGFARSYAGQRKDRGEAEELAQIIELARTDRPDPTKLEQKGQNKQATDIMEWTLAILSQTAAMPADIVELVLLIEWLKVAAMAPDVDEEIYCIVRQSAPVVYRAYEPILAGGS